MIIFKNEKDGEKNVKFCRFFVGFFRGFSFSFCDLDLLIFFLIVTNLVATFSISDHL